MQPVLSEQDERLTNVSTHIIKISALNYMGIETLNQEITNLFHLDEINLDNENMITNLRHKKLIAKAIQNVKKTQDALQKNMPLDIIAIFIQYVLEDLGKITGEVASEDIINEIFSKFCLGK